MTERLVTMEPWFKIGKAMTPFVPPEGSNVEVAFGLDEATANDGGYAPILVNTSDHEVSIELPPRTGIYARVAKKEEVKA